jgi:hypothetical protein
MFAAFTNVTVAENSSGAGGGGGLFTGGTGGNGGGIMLTSGSAVDLTHVTLASNAAAAGGGGSTQGNPGLGGGVFTANATTGLTNSIIASNAPGNCFFNNPSQVVNGGNNVQFAPGNMPCPMPVSGDPLLGPLADNGGPTKTMALGEGSSAIDLVPVDACPAVDQRGVTRPQRNACDAGAFELEPPPPPETSSGSGGQGSVSQNTTPTTNQQPATTTPPADKTPPTVKLALTRQKLLRALKKGYFAFFFDNELGNAVADLFATGTTARGAAVRKRVAHGTLQVTKTGKQKLVVKFTKKAKRAFAKRKKVVLTLVLTVKDQAGNATKKTAKVTLKR